MQNTNIYIYKNKTEVQLSDSFGKTRNKIVYASDLVIHKNVDNVLYFQFKNADQKRIPIGNKDFTFIMFDERTLNKHIIVDLPINIIDASTGAASVLIPEQYLYDVENGKYNYSIRVVDADGITQSAYVDDNYGVRGTVDVRQGASPTFRESKVFTFDPVTNLTDVATEITNLHQNSALHTIVIKFAGPTGFSGSFIVQATMDNITNQAAPNFFDLAEVNFLDQSDNITLNFNGVFSGIRFLQGVTSGEITEIQYRY